MSTLLVASAGGHLQELFELYPRLVGVDADVTWVTFDTAQARSLLAGQQVRYARYAGPRSVVSTLRNVGLAAAMLRGRRFDHVVSTGSTIAVSFLPLARARHASCHYIESATRITGPSLTAKLLRPVPGIHLYTQHEAWSGPRWAFRGSVFDGFGAVERDHAVVPMRIVVSLGSLETHQFRALLDHLVPIIPDGAHVIWQTGCTDTSGLGIRGQVGIPSDELLQAMTDADVVVAHAGVGTALMALRAGRCPVLVPRRRARREHVDDHQVEIAQELERAGLATNCEADALTFADLERAAGRAAHRLATPPAFELVTG